MAWARFGHDDAACQFSGKIDKSSTTARCGGALRRASNSRACACVRRVVRARACVRARKVKVEYFVPTPRSIGVHESAL